MVVGNGAPARLVESTDRVGARLAVRAGRVPPGGGHFPRVSFAPGVIQPGRLAVALGGRSGSRRNDVARPRHPPRATRRAGNNGVLGCGARAFMPARTLAASLVSAESVRMDGQMDAGTAAIAEFRRLGGCAFVVESQRAV